MRALTIALLALAWTALLGSVWLLGMWLGRPLHGTAIYGYGAALAFGESLVLLIMSLYASGRR